MTTINSSDVRTIISRALNGTNVTILDHKLEAFSAEKNGILGEHCLLSVKLKDTNNREKIYKFFVKLLGDIKKLPEHLDVDVFEEEIKFYNEIQPLMLANYEGEKWSVKCYLAKSGILVLEDLRACGFTVRSEQTMDEKSSRSAVASLARFHACSIMAEFKLGKPWNEAFSKSFSEKICNDSNGFGKAVKLGYKTNVLMAKKLNLNASDVLAAVYDHVAQLVRPRVKGINVVCHSDLYKHNIMFDADNVAVILDYQLLRYASPAIDMSILFHLNTSPEFRRKSVKDVLKYYHMIFCDTLQHHKVKIDVPSYESTVNDYEKFKIVGMATSVDYLASLYLNPDVRYEIWNDSEKLEKFLLHNRIDVLGPQLESDSEYARKMKDILSEYLIEAKRVLGSSLSTQ